MSFNFVPQTYAAFTPGSEWNQPTTSSLVASNGCASDGVATITGLQCLIGNILTPLPAMIALAAVVMMIFAGIKIINAGADPKAYAAGWSTFSFAAIGLVLLSVVWLVIVLIKAYTGADITNFGI